VGFNFKAITEMAFTQALHLTVQVDGLDGILDALEEIPKIATEKNVVRRALVDAAEPIRATWAELAPYDATTRDCIFATP
jgi:hypothetical protein